MSPNKTLLFFFLILCCKTIAGSTSSSSRHFRKCIIFLYLHLYNVYFISNRLTEVLRKEPVFTCLFLEIKSVFYAQHFQKPFLYSKNPSHLLPVSLFSTSAWPIHLLQIGVRAAKTKQQNLSSLEKLFNLKFKEFNFFSKETSMKTWIQSTNKKTAEEWSGPHPETSTAFYFFVVCLIRGRTLSIAAPMGSKAQG